MNNIRDNIKKNIGIIIFIIIEIIMCFFDYGNMIFISNILIAILNLLKAKFSFFSLKTLIINYILMPVFFQYNFNESYGVLSKNWITLYYTEINIIILIYNLFTYLYITKTNILNKEKDLLLYSPEISKTFCNIVSIIAIVASIIALPHLPFQIFNGGDRFNAILPGRAWNHLAVVSLLFLLPKIKESKMVKIAYIFVIFWFISHYERVDIIGITTLLFLVFMVRTNKKIDMKYVIKICLAMVLVLCILICIGEIRSGNTNINIIKKILVQNTASDIGYVFNSSIDYIKNNNKLLGKTYFNYIIEMIPLLDSQQRVELILQKEYNTPGGNFLLCEPIMNFGIIGVIIFIAFEILIFNFILDKKSHIRQIYYVFLIATSFRTIWYGINYIETAAIYFIPAIYLLHKIIEKHTKKNKKGYGEFMKDIETKPPLVSVIITTYNRKIEILERAINSVVNQSYKNIEVILINACPENKELEKQIKELAVKYEQIKYICLEENSLAGKARNTGLKVAKGEYIAFLDDDDEWIENKIELQVKKIMCDESKKMGIVYCSFYEIKNNNKRIIAKYTNEGDVIEEILANNILGGASMPLILKEAIDIAGGFDEKFPSSQDYDLWIRICNQYNVGYVNEPLVNYYVSDDAITRDMKKRILGWNMLEEKYKDLFMNNKKSYNKFLNIISYQLRLNGYKKESIQYWQRAIKVKKISIYNLVPIIKFVIVKIINIIKK